MLKYILSYGRILKVESQNPSGCGARLCPCSTVQPGADPG